MAKPANENLLSVLRMTREMLLLADLGDETRDDAGCGILYGALRDAAWKVRRLAELEREAHIENGTWDLGALQGERNGSLRLQPQK